MLSQGMMKVAAMALLGLAGTMADSPCGAGRMCQGASLSTAVSRDLSVST